MRDQLLFRLQRVARKIVLIERLRKVALSSEEEMIDRMSERSKKVLLGARGKLFKALKAAELTLTEEGQSSLRSLADVIRSVVTEAGVVDTSKLPEVKGNQDALFKPIIDSARKGAAVPFSLTAKSFWGLMQGFDKFLTVAMLGSRLQDARFVELAKQNQAYRDRLYKAMEQLARTLPEMQEYLAKFEKNLPSPSAPVEEPSKDSTALEAVEAQLRSAEGEMRAVVSQLSKLIVKRSSDLLGDTAPLTEALDHNIFTLYNKNKVNEALNRDREFYQEALMLEHGSFPVDLEEELDSKTKKALYLSYRSFVMAVRALGVLQFAASKPELVLKSQKAQELVVKSQEILRNRKDKIVSFLSALKKEAASDKERKEEKGVPNKSFSEFFQE